MKRLRLIKPWNLQAVRQRLDDGRYEGIEALPVSCCGPEAGMPGHSWADEEGHDMRHTPSEHRGGAPFSDVIFVPSNIRN